MKVDTIDIPVALIFFNRPDTLQRVFDSICRARPSKLFLIQDGVRKNNPQDPDKVAKCREIVKNVDWPCKIKRIYREENRGVAYNIFSGITEVFEEVDRLVIIEDDIVIEPSFLLMCKDLLNRYENDERIFAITGMNHKLESSECPYSYFFSDIGSCWGWATWKRSWEKMEFYSDFLEDRYAVKCFLNSRIRTSFLRKEIIRDSEKRRKLLSNEKRVRGWAHQFMTSQYMNSGLWIVPRDNLISNIGLSADSAHAASSLRIIPHKLQQVFFGKTKAITYPLIHPKYIITDTEYANEVLKILGEGIIPRILRRIETWIRIVLFSDWRTKASLINKVFHMRK